MFSPWSGEPLEAGGGQLGVEVEGGGAGAGLGGAGADLGHRGEAQGQGPGHLVRRLAGPGQQTVADIL